MREKIGEDMREDTEIENWRKYERPYEIQYETIRETI